jgi:hypothetical protein
MIWMQDDIAARLKLEIKPIAMSKHDFQCYSPRVKTCVDIDVQEIRGVNSSSIVRTF